MKKESSTDYQDFARQLAKIDSINDRKSVIDICQNWISIRRSEAKTNYQKTKKPTDLVEENSNCVDVLLSILYETFSKNSDNMSIIAVGGYGRCELFPYSDIDILFLHQPNDSENTAKIVEDILYILWDLGYKVGQSHRTITESLDLAKSDITIRTNLLDARFITGDKKLFENFKVRFLNEIIKDRELEFVEAKLAERDARHARFGDSRYMLEPNVKEGKGGLRDAHTLWWLAKAVYGVSSFSELVEKGLVSKEEYKAFEQARIFLSNVRINLHYIAGRAEERITFDYQHSLALAMGFNHPMVNRTIERFMRRYFIAVRNIGNSTRVFCALLEDERKRKPKISFASLWHRKWNLGNFKIDGERLTVKHDYDFENHPINMLELFKVSQENELDIHPAALKLIGKNLRLINSNLQREKAANDIFLEILLSKRSSENTLRKMSESGVLGRFIREFGRVIGQTQFNMYHVYTVDEHTLVAIGILHAIENGLLKDELPLASDLIGRIRLRRVLYLALFCHDIAKGQGGDHSELGEKVAIKLAKRMGFSVDEIETTGWLVRYHLLFSNTATKRDLNDPKTVQDFVKIVQSPERLKLLLILTVADIRAVSPQAWNNWKGVLLRDLYKRSEQYMGTGVVELQEKQSELFFSDLQNQLIGWNISEIEHYIAQGSPNFWASVAPKQHGAIARMVKEAEKSSQPIFINTEHDYNNSISEIIVCTVDEHGLFSKIAGAISLAGANIINAKIFTLKNGIAVEIFQLQDLQGEAFDNSGKLAKMAVYIEQVLSGEMNIRKEFESRTSKYMKSRNKSVLMLGQVLVDNDASSVNSVIELTGRDRSGLLHDVTSAIASLGLSIVTAHISTYGTQVADVFYVKDSFGFKVTHTAKLKQINETLLAVLNKKA